MKNFPIFPEQASALAAQSDALFWVLTLLTVAFTLLVAALVVFLSYRYRRGSKVDRSRQVHTSHVLELSWSVGPLFIGLAVFVWAAKLYAQMYGTAPKDAQEVYVIGKQWMWHVQHMNGIRENNELHVPIGKPVKLVMISQDVIHSFFIPAFRIKRDVIPGRYTSFWFTPSKAGKYHLFCAEYCGTQHSEMTGYVYVQEPAEYDKWLATGGQRMHDTQPIATSMVEKGAQLYERYNCGSCHDKDGMNRGPSLAGLYGSKVNVKGGGSVLADDAYLRKSILEPIDQIADGYQQIMPSYKDQFSEEQVLDILAYIKSIGSSNSVISDPKTTAKVKGMNPAASDSPSAVKPATLTAPTVKPAAMNGNNQR